MKRCFIDASVFYAAIYSEKGSARELMNRAVQGKVGWVTSEEVLEETRRNLARKASPVAELLFDRFLGQLSMEVVQISRHEVEAAAAHVAAKDAHIVAAARKARVDYLATFDRKHLLNNTEVAAYARTAVMEPQVILARLDEEAE